MYYDSNNSKLNNGKNITLNKSKYFDNSYYVVLNDIYEVSDFNKTFVDTFHIKDFSSIRGKSFELFLIEVKSTLSFKYLNA